MTQEGGPAGGLVRGTDATPLIEGPLGAFLLAGGRRTSGTVSFVIHTLAPRALGSPVHTHHREDEWSYVLDGSVGFELDGETSVAVVDDLILKPRGVAHAFWNAGDESARLLEVITPSGFEGYFERLADAMPGGGPPDVDLLAQIAGAYGLDIDPSSIARLAQAHDLHMG